MAQKQYKNQRQPHKIAYKANYLDRFKAQVIDMFMIYTPILYITTYIILQNAHAFRESDLAHFTTVALYGIISALFTCISSQTPGCRAQGIAIVSKTGIKISFIRATLRFVLFILCSPFMWAVFVPSLWRSKTTLHDMLCATVVIKQA